MHIDPLLSPLVGTVASLLLLGLLLKTFRQPEMLGYLLAGVVIGPGALALVNDPRTISHLGSMGVTLLLFFIGMEIEPRQLLSGWRTAILGTLLQIVASVTVAWAIGQAFEWPMNRILLLGFVISLSSTAVVLKLLRDRAELDTRVGRDVLMILLAQDLAVVPMLIVIGLLGPGTTPSRADIALQVLGGAAVLCLAVWLLSRERVHLPFARRLREDHELQVFAALLACFGLAFLTGLLQLSSALGAFLAGMLVGAARETDWVHRSLDSFRTVFVALFFVSVGMLIDLQFVRAQWSQILLLVIAVLLTNTFINAIAFRALGSGWRDSLYAGALLSQVGEFSFVLAAVGLQARIISEYAHQITVAVIAASLLLSPAWIAGIRRAVRVG